MSRRDRSTKDREPRGESRRSRTLGRRTFFARLSGATAAATLLPLVGCEALADKAGMTGSPSDQFSDHQRQTLAAVQQHLFPTTPDAPGARDIRAMVYLNAEGILDEVIGRIPEAGGKVIKDRTEIPPHGSIAIFEDSEGNVVGLHSMS